MIREQSGVISYRKQIGLNFKSTEITGFVKCSAEKMVKLENFKRLLMVFSKDV